MVNDIIQTLILRPVAQPLIVSPYTLTDTWTDIGPILNVKNTSSIAIWFDLTINDSRNVQFRGVGLKSSSDTDEFRFPIQIIEPDIVKMLPELYEIDEDEDLKMAFQIDVGELIPYAKIQIRTDTVGATAGTINSLAASSRQGRR
jgi:hypothetical protein